MALDSNPADSPASIGPASEPKERPAGVKQRFAVAAAIAAMIVTLTISILLNLPQLGAGLLLLVGLPALFIRQLGRANTWLFIIVATIMFIPIRLYAIPAGLPVELEPYRLVLPASFIAVLYALLSRRGMKYQRLEFTRSITFFLLTLAFSITFNSTRLVEANLAGTALTALINLGLLFIPFFVVRQLLSSESRVHTFLKMLVFTGAIVAWFAIVERVVGINFFWRLDDYFGLVPINEYSQSGRGGGARSFSSAQHPIALAVMLTALIPITVYLAIHGRKPSDSFLRKLAYAGIGIILLGGIGATVSRTSVIGIAAAFLMLIALRPYLAVTLAGITSVLFLIALLVQPKIIEDTVLSFLDFDSLIESQYTSAGSAGAGRLADLEPAMEEVRQNPFFGVGFGYRIVVGDEVNAFIVDNQYLGTLLDAGVVGLVGLIVFLFTPLVAAVKLSGSKVLTKSQRDLAVAMACALASYTAASYLYDTLNFIQAFLVYTFLLAITAWLLKEHRERRLRSIDEKTDAVREGTR